MEHVSPLTATTYEALAARAEPRATYIRTESARALLGSCNEAGLVLSDDAAHELMSEDDRRHGNGYAWLTRELAKSIAGQRQHIFEPEEEWSEQAEDYVTKPLPVDHLSRTGEPGADVIIDILQQVSRRNTSSEAHLSDIPVAAPRAQLKLYGCKDVETYFAQSVQQGKIKVEDIGGKRFWHKFHGGPTLLNLEPLQYNGVELPPGCVFREEKEGTYTFLRVTGFTFSQEKAAELFGGSITEWYEMRGGKAEMDHAFDAFAAATTDAINQSRRPLA